MMSEEANEVKEVPEGTMVMCDDGVEREVVYRKTAMEAGSNRYFTGEVCKNGHMAERKVKGYACTVCFRERQKARIAERMANDPEYKEKMAEKRRERHKERYANDPEYRQKILDRSKESRAARKGKLAEAEEELSS